MFLCNFFYRFTVENFLIEKHVRYILTVYPVIIYALIGGLSKHYDAAEPGRNAVFSGKSMINTSMTMSLWLTINIASLRYKVKDLAICYILMQHCAHSAYSVMLLFSTVVLLVMVCIVLVVRVGLVVWRHRTQPLFHEVNHEVLMSPNSGADK